jgi:predicted aldo/keto reductase-like oxidoreductase
MRLPMTGEGENKAVDRELAVPMLHRAFEAGVTYVDTAVGYCNQDSQRALGEALKGWRDKTVVSTKNHYYGEDKKEWWTHLENSLERLNVAYIDIYNHHGLNWKRYTEDVEPRVGKWMREALDQGLIKHICCSFHDDSEALRRLVDTGYVESITLQYNLLNRDLEESIAYAKEKNTGVVVMGPVAGGRLGVRSDVLAKLVPGVERVPELALRFVLSNPNVTVALSGMSTMQHVEENVVTAGDEVSLSPGDTALIVEHMERLSEMAKLYCTGCKYCMPCPQEVNIPRIFELYQLGQVYGLWDIARDGYRDFPDQRWYGGTRADACIECGECEEKCPQNIRIREQLKAAHEVLSARAS